MSSDAEAAKPASQPTESSSPDTSTPLAASSDPSSTTPATPGSDSTSDSAGEPQGASSSATGTNVTESRPSERIQIGTQKAEEKAELEPKPVTPISSGKEQASSQSGQSGKYPLPNVRDQLPPELEQELQAALGDESIESIIEGSSSVGATGAELAPETKVTGTVAKVHRDDVFLELGGRNQGLLPLKQFEKSTPPEVGSQLEVVVSRFDEEQGLYEVTLPTAAVSVGNWDEVEVGQIVEVTITGSNKGGLECQIAGIRGFIPMGQISIYRVENAEEYVGKKLSCVITEANRSRRNLVLSHRALMEREKKELREKLLAELAPGQIREGVVRNLQSFGAFVDLGGVDGLIHVSQLSWDRVNHPRDVLQEGQTVKVRIEKINPDNGKISLVYRDLAESPWKNVPSKYATGTTVKGHVTKLMQFGAFVKLEPGVEGLIHISEMGHGRVNRPGDVVSEGQEVDVKVLSVDPEAQRIGLSLKALIPQPDESEPKTDADDPIPSEEELQKIQKKRKADKHLKGGISSPSGGEKFGLKW